MPYIECAHELKTKPTQHSVKELRSIGINPSILLCRAERPVDESIIDKIAKMCSVNKDYVLLAPNVDNIYKVPMIYHDQGLDGKILKYFNLDSKEPNLKKWRDIFSSIDNKEGQAIIAIAGKYTEYSDSYKSLLEAIDHASIYHKIKIKIKWVNIRNSNKNKLKDLENIDAILVPGGFGDDGMEGKIAIVNYARKNKIPYLGICLGMQMALLEFARNKAGISNAVSSESESSDGTKLISMMHEWEKGGKKQEQGADLGGTMRLGSYPCNIHKDTLAYEIYAEERISERHRHRYEVNINYKKDLEDVGLIFSGMSPDGKLAEIIELKDHPFFIGVQFHPELKSKPFLPHPIFLKFIKAAKNYKSKQ